MLTPGQMLSHYKIISAIGVGGMGEVYLAVDTRLDRKVALKILPSVLEEDAERLGRFIREAKATSALNHPNILTVFEIGSFEDSHYIAAELINGKTLREQMQSGPMDIESALAVSSQIAAALTAAHGAGIIHRDIKPENVMIRDDGIVKVLDFGLAKKSGDSPVQASSEDVTKALVNTTPGMVFGTAAYMSPEQARGQELDARSDIFSLGIVMYETLTGTRPFGGDTPLDAISSILKDEPVPLRQLRPELSRELEHILEKALRKDRELRYQNVKDLFIDIEDFREERKFEARLDKSGQITAATGIHSTDPDDRKVTLRIPASLSKKRRFTLLQAIVSGVLFAGLIGAFLWYRSGTGQQSASPPSYKVVEVANWSSAPGELFSNASFSPDGKLIAFSSTKSGSKNIWVTQTSSTDAIQITSGESSNKDPIWSPKGDEIAFFSERGNLIDSKANSTGVWRVSALGGSPKSIGPITDGSAELRRWTESGKIYYQSNKELFSIDVLTGESVQVTSLGQPDGTILWVNISPDEKKIAYAKQIGGLSQLITSNLDNSGRNVVLETREKIKSVEWLSDRGQFVYSAVVEGILQIFRLDTGSGRPVRITSADTDNDIVDVAPDGGSLLYSSVKEESNLWKVTVADQKESPVSRTVNSELFPAGAPRDDRIAFQSIKNLSQGQHLFDGAIMVRSVSGGSDTDPATTLAENGYLPAWSPDGSAIAFLRPGDNGTELFTANPNGGGEKRLVAGGIPGVGYSISPYNTVQTNAFAWSPDGSAIAYIADRGASNVWLVSPRDGSDTQITGNNDPNLTYACPVWSSDGKRIAFRLQAKKQDETGKLNSGLGVVNVETREVKELQPASTIFRLIGWSPDDSRLIVAASEKSGSLPPEVTLSGVELTSGSDRKIVSLENTYFYNIFLSADRKYVAYAARNDDKDDIWIVPSTGGESRKLTSNIDSSLYFSRLAWLHDSKAIVFGKQTRFSLLSMITDLR